MHRVPPQVLENHTVQGAVLTESAGSFRSGHEETVAARSAALSLYCFEETTQCGRTGEAFPTTSVKAAFEKCLCVLSW